MARKRDAVFTTPQGNRPWPARAGMALARPFAGRIDVSAESLIAKAVAGHPELTEEALLFRPALEALCHSLEHEAQLHVLGRITARDDTARIVRTQLRVNRELARRPEILETRLPTPLIILGLPRSGTTILQTLLAQDPENRALLYYEGFDPVAPEGEDQRRQKLGRMLGFLEYLAPGYRAIHAMDPDIILQGAIFEIVTTEVAKIPIPAAIFEEFGLEPEALQR